MTSATRLQSFRARLTLRWTLAVGLLLGLANLAVYGGTSFYLRRWLDEHVSTVAATETASSTDGLTDVHLHESPYAQLEAGSFTEKFVQIFDRQGALVLQSTSLSGGPRLVSPETLERAFSGHPPMFDAWVGGRRVRGSVLTASRGPREYAVAVGLYADDVDQGLGALALMLGAVWLGCIAASAAIGYALASRALAPVAQITERAAWIARGNFDARLDPPTVHDEVGRMTVLLNSMLDRLQRAVDTHRRFAADASHELRSPLTAMTGELDVALRHPRSAAEYQTTLLHVRGQVAALTSLAENLMLLARVQEGAGEITLRDVPILPLVEKAFAGVAASAQARGITLSHDGLAPVRAYADPDLLARVVDNVIANAVHYNRDGGSVAVSARVAAPARGEWAPTLVTLLVADTGAGIPAAAHERVFERFFRLDESRRRHTGGSGLGLAICREVLGAMRGTIRVGASSPAGTTIEITLPGEPAPAPAAAAATDGTLYERRAGSDDPALDPAAPA